MASGPEPGALTPYSEGVKPYGKYFLVRKIAEGGMAEIFLAKQLGEEGFERNVVIKRMHAYMSRTPEFVGMFLDEARLAARLAHPNIIAITDLGLADGCYFLCMEYLPGEDLSTVLRTANQRGELTPANVVARILIDAAQGLHFAHEFTDEYGKPLNVVHRDISPSNIYVTYQGTAKVLDFGIAKAESRITRTTAGTVKGKYVYMAPEQADGTGAVDRRADVYSLGVTLYEALTHQRPFARDTDLGILNAVLKGDFRRPREIRPEIPAELEAIALKAMSLRPADRYPTARELANALELYLGTTTPGSGASQVTSYLVSLFGEEHVAERSRIPTLVSLARAGVSVPPLPGLSSDHATPSGARAVSGDLTAVITPHPNGRPRRPWLWAGALGLLGAVALVGLLRPGQRWRTSPSPPIGCADLSRAGLATTYGDLRSGSIHLGATMNLTSSAGTINVNKVRNVDAMIMAVDEMNTRGGAGRRTFVLHVCDSANDPGRLKAQLDWLINQEGVAAVIVPGSTQVINAASVAGGALIMSATATSPDISSLPGAADASVPLIWRTAPSDVLQGRVLADLLSGDADAGISGRERIGIIYSGESYGQGLETVISDRLTSGNDAGRALASFEYPLGGDVTRALAQLAGFRPNLTVLIGLPGDAVKILDAAGKIRALTVEGGNRWVFTDAVKDPAVLNGVSDPNQLRNALGTTPAQRGGSAYPSFHSRYINRFGADPGSFAFSSHSYDATYLLGLAASAAIGEDNSRPLTGTAMAEALTRVSDPRAPLYQLGPSSFIPARIALQRGTINVEGASGKLDFDPGTGDVVAPIEVWGVADGGFVTLEVIEPPSRSAEPDARQLVAP